MTSDPVADLGRAFEAVGELIARIEPRQWEAPTPCTEWTARDVVAHLVGLNLVFTALLEGGPMPDRQDDPLGADPLAAYRTSAAAVTAAFGAPGVLDKTFSGPLGDDPTRESPSRKGVFVQGMVGWAGCGALRSHGRGQPW